MHNTSLLDTYLQGTWRADARQGVSAQHQQPSSSTPATQFNHQRAIGDIHHALDEVLITSQSREGDPQQQQTWLGALAGRNRGPTAIGSQREPSSPAYSKASTSRKAKGQGQQIRNIFKSMRQADASALLEQKLQTDHAQQQPPEQQQQPIFPAPEDHVNSTVRIIAGNAALQVKLQRLQADMEARSYRQDLLQQLQTPTTMFPPTSRAQQQPASITQPPVQQVQEQHEVGHQWLIAGGSRPAGIFPGGVNAPQSHTRPPAAYSTAATAGDTCNSSFLQDSPGCAKAGTAHVPVRSVNQQLQHLKELLEYEPPWPASGAATAVAQRRSSPGSCPGSVYRPRDGIHQRPWTSSAATPACRKLGLDGRAVSVRQQTLAASSDKFAVPSREQQQQQREHVVPRPASAVAALEQSLSELASLRSRLTHQEQHLEVPLQHQLPPQQQIQSEHQRHQHCHSSSGWQEQQPCQQHQQTFGNTWMQDARLQQHFGRSSGGGASAAAAGAPPQPAYTTEFQGHLNTNHSGAAAANFAVNTRHHGFSVLGAQLPEPDPAFQYSHFLSNQRSVSPYNGVWDAWQHQVQQQTAAAAAAGYGSYSLLRPKSAPRPVRAWDAVPVPRASATGFHSHHRSRSYSSSGLLTGQVQLLRQQQQQHTSHLQRPKTTGGIQHSGRQQQQQQQQQQRGLHSGVRPLGLHNETVRPYVRAPEATTTKLGSNASTQAAKPSAWLTSSPLQRTKQQLASAAARETLNSIGAARIAAGAGRRARAVAAVLADSALPSTARTPGATAAQVLSKAANSSSPVKEHGRAAAAATELLHRMRETRGLPKSTTANRGIAAAFRTTAAGSRARSPTLLYANRLSAITGRLRNSSGGAATGATAQAPLAHHVKEYALHRYKSLQATCSTDLSDMSSDDVMLPPRAQQSGCTSSAYAAALARVRAATAAAGDSSSDSDTD